jgi:hypothetical protein
MVAGGQILLFTDQTATGSRDILSLRLTDRKTEPFEGTSFVETAPEFCGARYPEDRDDQGSGRLDGEVLGETDAALRACVRATYWSLFLS